MTEDDNLRTLAEPSLPHRSHDVPGDDLIETTGSLTVTGRADCCPASAIVRVVLAATASSAQPGHHELLLCAHHYRAAHNKLAATGASVFDSANRLICSSGGTAVTDSLWPPV